MAGFMAVGADGGHLSECAIFAIKKTNGTYVWPEARGPRLGLEKQPAVAAQWVARAMFVDARSHVGDPRRGSPCTVGSAGGQSITTVRQSPPVGAIDYRLHAHHDQKKDRARQPPATLAPSHPKPLHAGNSQAPACGAPASRQRERDLRPGLQRLLSSRGKQPPPEEKDVPFGTSEKRAFPAPVKPTELINGHLLHRRTQADCR